LFFISSCKIRIEVEKEYELSFEFRIDQRQLYDYDQLKDDIYIHYLCTPFQND